MIHDNIQPILAASANSPVGGPIGSIHQPRNFKYYEVFLHFCVPMGFSNNQSLVAQVATLGNSWKSRKSKMAATKKIAIKTYFFVCVTPLA